jgi:hypothetical protein
MSRPYRGHVFCQSRDVNPSGGAMPIDDPGKRLPIR